MRVGFIGLGSMGGDQVRCLLERQFEVTVFDAFPQAMQAFQGQARLAASVADVAAHADIVGVCVRDDAQVTETLDGPDGLIANLQPAAVILVHSTVNPETILALAKKANARGIELLDATVSRSQMANAGPFLSVMIGGKAEVIEKVRPVIDAYAVDVFHAGSQGAGAAMKIVNNLVTWSSIVATTQAFRLAKASGVNLEVLHALMTSNSNFTRAASAFSFRFLGAEMDKTFMESQLGIGLKDLSLAEEIANKAAIEIPVALHSRGYLPSAMLDE